MFLFASKVVHTRFILNLVKKKEGFSSEISLSKRSLINEQLQGFKNRVPHVCLSCWREDSILSNTFFQRQTKIFRQKKRLWKKVSFCNNYLSSLAVSIGSHKKIALQMEINDGLGLERKKIVGGLKNCLRGGLNSKWDSRKKRIYGFKTSEPWTNTFLDQRKFNLSLQIMNCVKRKNLFGHKSSHRLARRLTKITLMFQIKLIQLG